MYSDNPFEGYDLAQVCVLGHVITTSLELLPNNSKPHCPQCGQETISVCNGCGFPIRGSSTEVFSFDYDLPKYCENCGDPYPWTVLKISTINELSSFLDNLSDDEKHEITKSILSLSVDTPTTPIAALKVKKLLTKVGEDAYRVAIKVITDIATEAAKKELGF